MSFSFFAPCARVVNTCCHTPARQLTARPASSPSPLEPRLSTMAHRKKKKDFIYTVLKLQVPLVNYVSFSTENYNQTMSSFNVEANENKGFTRLMDLVRQGAACTTQILPLTRSVTGGKAFHFLDLISLTHKTNLVTQGLQSPL